MSSERRKEIKKLRGHEEKLSAIYDLSREMSLNLDLDRISELVLDAAEKVLKFSNIDLFLVNEKTNELHLKECRGLKEPEMVTTVPLSGEKGIIAYVARTEKSLNIPDVRKDERYLLGLKGSRSELCIPIKIRDKIIGVMDAESEELNAFSEEDQRLLETLASQAAIAIENARLYEELSSLKEFNETIVKSLNEGIWVEDEQGFCTYANPKMNKMLGYESLVGKHWREIVAPEELDRMQKETNARQYGSASSYESIFLASNGEKIPVIISSTPLFEKGKYIGTIAVWINIREQKWAEEKLRESEELYRSLSEFNEKLLENSPTGIMNINKEMKVEYENPEMRRILGLPFGRELSAMGMSIQEAPLIEETGVSPVFNDLIEGKEIAEEALFTFPDGKRGYLTFRGVPLLENSQFIGAVLIVNDITELKRAEEKLSAIYDLSREMGLSLDLDHISELVLEAAEKILNFGNIGLLLVDEEKNELNMKGYRGLEEPETYAIIPISSEKGITAYVARTGEPLNIPDVRKDERYLFGLKDSRSELSVPIKVKDKIIGVIDAESKELNAFSEEDQRLLETLASQAAVAIENARLYEQAQHEITERKQSEQIQSVLHKIANAVNTTENLFDLFKSIQNHLGKIIDTTNFVIALYDKNTDTISLPYYEDEKDKFTSFPAGKSLSAYVIKRNKPFLATWDEIKELIKAGEVEPVGTPTKIWLGVPLKLGEEILGVVVVQSYTDASLYTERDLEILEFVSGQIAIAIERKRAEEALQESKKKIERLHEIAAKMETAESEEEVYHLAMEAAGKILDFSIASIMGAEGNYLKIKVTNEENVPEDYKMSIDEGLGGKAYRTGKSYLINDITKDRDAKPTDETYRSVISIPIGNFGVFQTHSNKVGHFKKEDLEIAELLVSHITGALKRIQSEKVLRDSEERYRMLFDSIADPVLVFDKETHRILDCNESFITQYGYTRDELRTMTPLDLHCPEELEIDSKRLKKIIDDTEDTSPKIYTHITKDGKTFPIETHSVEFVYRGQKAWISIFRDITERKQAERKINNIYELSREMALTLDIDQISEVVSDFAEKVLNFKNFTFFLFDEKKREVYKKSERGFASGLGEFRVSIDEETGVAIHAAKTGKTIYSPDVSKDPRYIRTIPEIKSELAVPIMFKEKIFGVLNVESEKLDGFSEDGKRLLETLASQTAIAIQNAQLYEQAQQEITERKEAEEKLSTIYDLSRDMSLSLDLNEVFEKVLDACQKGLEFETIYLFLIDEKKQELYIKAQRAYPGEPTDLSFRMSLKKEKGIITWVANHGESLNVSNVSKEPRYVKGFSETKTKSELTVPLKIGEKVIGVLNAESKKLNGFSEEDQRLLETLASQAAVAIENARLYEQAQHEITERKQSEQIQSVLHKIANAANITENLDDLFRSIRTHLGTIVDTTNFTIALYDKKTDTISLPYFEDEKDTFISFPAKKTLTAYAIKKNKPLLITGDIRDDLIRKGELEPVGSPSKIWLGVPLRIGKEIIGIVVVQSYTDPHHYTEKDMEILEFVSGQIAVAIERKRAEKALREIKNKIERLHEIAAQMEAVQSEEETYHLTMNAAGRILDFSIASILYADGNYLKIKVTTEKNVPEDYKMSINEGVGGKTYRTGKSYLIRDITKNKDAKPTDEAYRSVISVPIGNFGVFQVHSTKKADFTSDDLKLAELLISHTTGALKRIQSEKELQKNEEKR